MTEEDNNSMNKIEVKINGKKTPLSIGDRIKFGKEDKESRYVTSLRVDESGCLMYLAEWVSCGEIKTQWVSDTELKIFNISGRKSSSKIGF